MTELPDYYYFYVEEGAPGLVPILGDKDLDKLVKGIEGTIRTGGRGTLYALGMTNSGPALIPIQEFRYVEEVGPKGGIITTDLATGLSYVKKLVLN